MTATKITPEEASACHLEPKPGNHEAVTITPMVPQHGLPLACPSGIAEPAPRVIAACRVG